MDKMKMLDITRDKPIKVAVKVAVPVRDHPKFNFVGKLLGPKGNSMKRLQEDTMCKMAVLGRGSMKDRKREEELRASGEPRYAHLAEDLHVEISTFAAPAEAHARIAYALAEVRRFLVPDYHDDIRQEQMWEMQALSSTSSQTQTCEQNSPNTLFGDDETSSVDIKTDMHETSGMENICDSIIPLNRIIPAATMDPTNIRSSTLNDIETNNSTLHVDLSTNPIIHPTAVSVSAAIRHQLVTTAATASTCVPVKPAPAIAAITGLTSNQSPAMSAIPSEAESTTTSTLALLEPPGALLHPALRGIKAVNIAGSLARKRPLLGVPRSGMNPTKRTVMTLLARAKHSQALHAIRSSSGSCVTISEPMPMIAPLIMPQSMEDNVIVPKEGHSQNI